MANRLCHDPNLFTIVIPTINKPEFLRNSLGFLESQGFAGQVVIADGSSKAMSCLNKKIVTSQKKIRIVYAYTAGLKNLWAEMQRGLKDIGSKYILLHSDDDFYFLDEIDYCLDFLEKNKDYVSARGRFVWIGEYQNLNKEIGQPRKFDQVGLSNMPMYSFTESVNEHRVVGMFNRYCHLFFSVMRSATFLKALGQVQKCFGKDLGSAWFDQFAFTIICGVRGKIHTSTALYCIRQKHPAQYSNRTAAAEPYRHWPKLLISPDFSDDYQRFRQCLIDSCQEFVSVSEEQLKSIIDYGLVTLIKRGFGVRPPLERQDSELMFRLKDSSSIDHQRMRQVIPFLTPILPEE